MRFRLPVAVASDDQISLSLDSLIIISLPYDQWPEYTSADGYVDVLLMPIRDRLTAACRLLLQSQGKSFIVRTHSLFLDVCQTLHPDKDRQTLIASFSGDQLLGSLDLVQADGLLIDGSPARRRRRPEETHVLAFYLPQFYPFAENDKWWGDGFTEWANVVEASPQLRGHHMPLLPSDLGFYDLRVADTRRRQGALAEEYGVDGFCYYFYWFNGRRVMRDVLDAILTSGVPANDFCLCWANESWSRRWDGSDGAADLLIRQEHDPGIDKGLIFDLIPYFLDSRYITIDGSPVILIYRLDIMQDAESVTAFWRSAASDAGFPGIFIAAVRSFGLLDDTATYLDAIIEFPPHTAVSTEIQNTLPVNPSFNGKIYDYRQVIINSVARPPGAMLNFPGVMPRWDNTPRKGDRSHLFWNSSPGAFKVWMSFALEQSQQLPLARRFLFINSWNEWGEGAMLEPDRVYGRSYLEALRSVRGGYTVGPSDISHFSLISSLPPDGAEALLQGFAAEVHMVSQAIGWMGMKRHDAFRVGPPEMMELAAAASFSEEGMMIIDHSSSKLQDGVIYLKFGQPLMMIGWAAGKMDETPRVYNRLAYLCLVGEAGNDIKFHVPVTSWTKRPDVSRYNGLSLSEQESWFGFEINVGTDNIAVGRYRCGMLESMHGSLYFAPSSTLLVREDQ